MKKIVAITVALGILSTPAVAHDYGRYRSYQPQARYYYQAPRYYAPAQRYYPMQRYYGPTQRYYAAPEYYAAPQYYNDNDNGAIAAAAIIGIIGGIIAAEAARNQD